MRRDFALGVVFISQAIVAYVELLCVMRLRSVKRRIAANIMRLSTLCPSSLSIGLVALTVNTKRDTETRHSLHGHMRVAMPRNDNIASSFTMGGKLYHRTVVTPTNCPWNTTNHRSDGETQDF